jgi:hypothetical protein
MGFNVFDDRANMKGQQLLIIGSDSRVARFGPTTPTRARRPLDASVDPTEARNANTGTLLANSHRGSFGHWVLPHSR